MISEFNPSINLDTNSPPTEDRYLFVHRSLYNSSLGRLWLDSKTLRLAHATASELENPREQRL